MSKFPTASFAGPAISILAACILVAASPAVHAWWVPNGVGFSMVTGDQLDPRACPDGMGGAIVAFQNSGADANIHAQRLSASGNFLWPSDGIDVCTAAAYQSSPMIAPDGVGGAIVVWQDERNGSFDIYAQRVHSEWGIWWVENGVNLCSDVQNQESPRIVADGSGGAIVAWRDNRSLNYDVYAQRVSAYGSALWTANGVALCTAAGSQTSLALAPDGAGGAIVAWVDFRGGNYDIYVQRVDVDGSARWTANGVALCTAAGNQTEVGIVADGTGGAIVTWTDQRGAAANVYSQRVNASGAVQWAANGIALYATTDFQGSPQIASDGAGGAIVSWGETRKGVGLYAQRVNASGTRLWPDGGVTMLDKLTDINSLSGTPDGSNGLIVVVSFANGSSYDLIAQRVGVSGALPWGSAGTMVCAAYDEQRVPTVAPDGAGGVIAAWRDLRNGTFDIYAQLVDAAGRAGWVAPDIASVQDVPGDQGGRVFLSWYAARADRYMEEEMSHYTIWRSIDAAQAASAIRAGASEIGSLADLAAMESSAKLESPGMAGASRPDAVIRVDETGTLAMFWELVDTQDALFMEGYAKTEETLFDSTAYYGEPQYFQVVAHTSDPKVYWKSAAAGGCSIDNLPPGAPVGLVGERSVSPFGLELTWEPNAESDFSCYALYRGLSEDFVPGALNLVAQLDETGYFDTEWNWGGYYYKLSAFDINGNESAFAIFAPDGVTDAETPRAPAASFLAQNFPNPFNPTTRIAFGLAAPADVSLRIYDAGGPPRAHARRGGAPAGNYSELWDGRDSSGRAVASGIYFYRLTAGAFTETRKMALLR